MSLAGIMGNLQHDSELMSERHKAQRGGWEDGWHWKQGGVCPKKIVVGD